MSKFYGSIFTTLRDVRLFDPLTGWQTRRTYRGTPAQMSVIRSQLALAGIRYEDDPSDGGYETVVASFSGVDPDNPNTPADLPLVNRWDLVGNMLEKDIWTHPKVTAIFDDFLDDDGFPTDTYAAVKKDIDDIVSGATLPSEVAWWSGASVNTKKFVRDLLRGVTSYPVSQYVLRNTLIVAENYNQVPPLTNVLKILTTDQVVSLYGVPQTIKFQMAPGFWLEQTPTVENTNVGEYTITREWWHHDTFSDFIYEAA